MSSADEQPEPEHHRDDEEDRERRRVEQDRIEAERGTDEARSAFGIDDSLTLGEQVVEGRERDRGRDDLVEIEEHVAVEARVELRRRAVPDQPEHDAEAERSREPSGSA